MSRDQSTWHRIRDVDPETKLGICTQCGPGTLAHFRKYNSTWVCDEARNRGKKEPHGLNRAEATLLRTGRVCEVPVCTKPAETVDHCHNSKIVRGVMCRDHNLALGYVHDSIEELEGLIEYLKMTQGVDGLARLGYAG